MNNILIAIIFIADVLFLAFVASIGIGFINGFRDGLKENKEKNNDRD